VPTSDAEALWQAQARAGPYEAKHAGPNRVSMVT
jgi:hypothetical protein